MTDPAQVFRSLHDGPSPLVMANPWDVGSAVILERLGFSALATTSSGMAFSLGKPDGAVPPDQVFQHCEAIASAVTIPVSGDLERGCGDSPDDVADTIRRAAAAGLAGCSIEDHTGRPADPIYPEALAVERVGAAVEAARALGSDFVLTARCESLLWTDRGLDHAISILQAYEAVGADVVFAPGLESLQEIGLVCEALEAPVSVGLEMADKPTVDALAEIGVARISVGAVFVRMAYGAMIESAAELIDRGTMDAAATALDYERLEAFFADPGGAGR